MDLPGAVGLVLVSERPMEWSRALKIPSRARRTLATEGGREEQKERVREGGEGRKNVWKGKYHDFYTAMIT